MTQNTAQSEAMQAVRLLRGHALSGELTQAQIEALYQACKLLEGFIEGAQNQSRSLPAEMFDSGFLRNKDGVFLYYYGDAFYRVGEYVYVKTPAEGTKLLKILSFYPENNGVSLVGLGYKGSCDLSEMVSLNLTGSSK
jgi:hypothetical protein